MRDHETIDIALKAAETGHLVLSTVHTTDAAKTINRLVSVYPADEQNMVRLRLADALKASISQRLLPRKGTTKRVVALEIMRSTLSVQECIRCAEKTPEMKQFIEGGRDQYGMISFDQHLSMLYKADLIEREVAKTAASNPSDFERALHFE
jgi:twitching motility protein PilT